PRPRGASPRSSCSCPAPSPAQDLAATSSLTLRQRKWPGNPYPPPNSAATTPITNDIFLPVFFM
ncbi:MAG: hypothetical protein AB7G11_16475, partial [Phycisphaerales bacterium]